MKNLIKRICIAGFAALFLIPMSYQQAYAGFGDWFKESIDSAIAEFMNSLDDISQKRVAEILAGVDKTAEKSIADGLAGGQLLTIQAGNQLKVASQGAAIILGNKIESTVGELDQSLKEILAGILAFEGRVQQVADQTLDFADLASLDIEILAGRVFGVDDSPLHLRGYNKAIVAKLPNGGSHSVELRGPNFGTDTSNMRTEYQFSLDGIDLGSGQPKSGNNSKHDRIVKIPHHVINKLVDENKIVLAGLKVFIKRQKTGRWRDFFGVHDDKEISLDLPITILPRKIGTITSELEILTYDFVKQQNPREETNSVKATTPISISLTYVNQGGDMKKGQLKFDRSSVVVTCASDIRNFRRFHQLRGQPIAFSATHSFFSGGYTAYNVGPGRASRNGNVDGPGTAKDVFRRIIARMSPDFGSDVFEPGTRLHSLIGSNLSTLLYHRGKVRESDWPTNYSMSFTAEQLIAASDPYQKDVTGCSNQSASSVTFLNDGELRVLITDQSGSLGSPAVWTVRASVLEWQEVGRDQKIDKHDVFIEDIVQIEVSDPSRSNLNLVFKSSILGIEKKFTLDSAPTGIQILQPGNVGDATVYKMKYHIPN